MTYLSILILYAVAMLAVGIISSRKSKGSSDFFVAGRGLGAGWIATTLLAANIGAGSTIGATGIGYKDGLTAWWWVGSAGLGGLVLAFTVGPKIWRVAKDNNLYTIGDYLEFRYDSRVRALTSILLWVGSQIVLSGQFIGAAALFSVCGINKMIGYWLAAIVATTYFALGGLHSTVRVNVLQLAVKLTGFAFALFFLLHNMPAQSLEIGSPKFGGAEFKYLTTLGPAFIISPGILQKLFGAKDEKAARWGAGLNAVGLLLFAIVPALLGFIAHAYFPNLPKSEAALPMLLTNALPFALGALLMAAVFAAELSAADALLFVLTTSLSKDLYKVYVNPQANDAQLVRIARISAVVCGALAASLAVWLETVYSALTIFYTLLTAALMLPLIFGLYTKKVSALAALAAMVVSVGVTFAVHFLTAGQGYNSVPPAIFGITLGAIALIIVSVLSPKTTPLEAK